MINSTYTIKTSDVSFDNVYSIFLELQQWISKHIEKELVIDCSLVKYIDSAGVAMLMELKKRSLLQYQKLLKFKLSKPIEQLLSFYSVENFLD